MKEQNNSLSNNSLIKQILNFTSSVPSVSVVVLIFVAGISHILQKTIFLHLLKRICSFMMPLAQLCGIETNTALNYLLKNIVINEITVKQI